MTDFAAPIELPTGRRSYIAPVSGPNIHDKDWIPVLDAADLKKVQQYQEKEVSPAFNPATFSLSPKIATPSPISPAIASSVSRPHLAHNYSKSSLAPESVTSELEGEALPPRTSSKISPSNIGSAISYDPSSQHLRQASADAPSTDGQETVTSDGADGPSTAGTNSLLEEQYYTLPDAPVSKEDIQPPPLTREAILPSARSSVASRTTKASIAPPTSKYSRKPVSNVTASGRPPTIRSQPTTPHDSPKLLPALPVAPPPIPNTESLPDLPAELAHYNTPPATPKISASKSTASERRQRALHSHPSHVSLASQAQNQSQSQSQTRSRANSSSSTSPDPIAKPPSVKHKPRKSTDSRTATTRGTIYDSQTPTPAPTTPLPQLPFEATNSRPSTRGNDSAKPPTGLGIRTVPSGPSHIHTQSTATTHTQILRDSTATLMPSQHQTQHSQPLPPTPSPAIQSPAEAHLPPPPPPAVISSHQHSPSNFSTLTSGTSHAELASFMTRTSTIVFRRFDDVHVKLLLCLQDEIGQLERELLRLEGEAAAPAGVDKVVARAKCLRELRRCVGEYDHLFANWSQMQATKATKQTMNDLKEWLGKPGTSPAGVVSASAREDARWLESQQDLSVVHLGGERMMEKQSKQSIEKARSVKSGTGGGGAGGGFANLFGCAGRRK